MQGFTAIGNNQYYSCQFVSDTKPVGQLTGTVLVQANVPALYAYISDPVTGAYPAGNGVTLTVTGPDGTVYNQDRNTSSLFARTVGGQLYVLYVAQPAEGVWTVSCHSTAAVSFRASVQTVPTSDPITASLQALLPRFQADPLALGETLEYDLFRWGYWSAAVLLLVASATTSLAINLATVVQQLCGVSATVAQTIVTLIHSQSADGVITTLAQQTNNAGPDVGKQVLQNGSADNGLTGWTVIANGGAGWLVQSGYSDAIDCQHNFAASYAWCKKSQLVDLVQGGGLTAAYLDQSPTITVTDWVTAQYPTGATAQSQYYLLTRLLDANQQTLKEFQTGTIALPLPPTDGSGTSWHRIQCAFDGYGSGVRYVYFEHGGLDPQQWDRQFGVKMTGATVEVQLALPQNPPAELLQNGNGQNGLTGWTNLSPVGNPWTTETGPGVACPVISGTTDFAVASGLGKKSQEINLLTAGYTATFLDTAPLIRVGQWIATSPDCTCSYTLKAELRDQNHAPIQTLDLGTIQTALSAGSFVGFQSVQQTFSNYGAGLRFLYFEHSASPNATIANQTPAKITGASVQIITTLVPQTTSVGLARQALAAPPPVTNTTVAPYKWVCSLSIGFAAGRAIGTGWLLAKTGQRFIVMTAAHNVYHPEYGWASDIQISPAAGGANPYTMQTVRLGRMQIPIDNLLKTQVQIGIESYDYATLVVDTSNWDTQGFHLAVETDSQLIGQAVGIAGFPSASPYTRGNMYQENLKLPSCNPTRISVASNFTGGGSGSPIYVSGATYDGIGVYSYGNPVIPYFNINLFSYAARVTQDTVNNVARWSIPLNANDRVCQFQMVVHTGLESWTTWLSQAGTDDPITLTLDGHAYHINPSWMPISGDPKQENEAGHFDGYDLTAVLQQNYPNGLFLNNLLNKQYKISRTASTMHSAGDWLVASVAFFVNGQLLCYDTFNRFLLGQSPYNEVFGNISIS